MRPYFYGQNGIQLWTKIKGPLGHKYQYIMILTFPSTSVELVRAKARPVLLFCGTTPMGFPASGTGRGAGGEGGGGRGVFFFHRSEVGKTSRKLV